MILITLRLEIKGTWVQVLYQLFLSKKENPKVNERERFTGNDENFQHASKSALNTQNFQVGNQTSRSFVVLQTKREEIFSLVHTISR